MDKQIVYPYNGLTWQSKGSTVATYNNMDESQNNYAE